MGLYLEAYENACHEFHFLTWLRWRTASITITLPPLTQETAVS